MHRTAGSASGTKYLTIVQRGGQVSTVGTDR